MSAPAAEAPEVFPPTLREVMLRPWWIGMLLFALLVAGVFAFLGQWQLSRSIDLDPTPVGVTEEVRPIAEVVAPGDYLAEPLVGQRVEVSGRFVPGDFVVVSSRFNEGAQGYWVTGQLRVAGTAAPTSLAVAIGWTDSREKADAAVQRLEERTLAVSDAVAADQPAPTLTGRLISDEGPAVPPHDDPTAMTRMSPAALLGVWHDTDGLDVYRPYLTSADPAEGITGLTAIHSPAPTELSSVNFLNLFYAIEWAVFAGFAFYMWYRLAKDAWQKEVEALEEAADGSALP